MSSITSPFFNHWRPRKFRAFLLLVRRIRHVILILIGRAPYAYERMEFEMALDKFNAAAAELKVAADTLIAHCGGHDAQIAQLTAELAAADDNATAAIQPVIDELNAAVPPAPPAA